MTLHLGSNVNRKSLDNDPTLNKMFKDGLFVHDTSIIMPPADFWGKNQSLKERHNTRLLTSLRILKQWQKM
jgi:hypothetical protein